MILSRFLPGFKMSDVQGSGGGLLDNSPDVEDAVLFGNEGVLAVLPPDPSPSLRWDLKKFVVITNGQLGYQGGPGSQGLEGSMGFSAELDLDTFQNRPPEGLSFNYFFDSSLRNAMLLALR
jgi:hypothetical protein